MKNKNEEDVERHNKITPLKNKNDASTKPKTRYRFLQSEEEVERSYKIRFANPKKWQTQAMMTRHNNSIARAKAAADEELWTINDKKYDRYNMMALLVAMVSEGYSLVEICDDDAYPSLSEVRSWEKNHPQFVEDMRFAETLRGERLAERGLKALTDLECNEEASANDIKKAGLVHESLTKHAAFFNKKYTPKAVQQVEDITDKLSEEQARQRLMAIIRENPAIADVVKKSMPQLAEALDTISDAVVVEQIAEGGQDATE